MCQIWIGKLCGFNVSQDKAIIMKVLHFCPCISPDCMLLDPFQCVIHKFSYCQCSGGNLVCGGRAHVPETLIDEWRRALVLWHISARDSIKGTLREGSFTGEPKRWGFWEVCKMPCKWASLSVGPLLGNLVGVCLSGLLIEKKSISGFFT